MQVWTIASARDAIGAWSCEARASCDAAEVQRQVVIRRVPLRQVLVRYKQLGQQVTSNIVFSMIEDQLEYRRWTLEEVWPERSFIAAPTN